MIYNLKYNVTMFSISASRVISPDPSAPVFTSDTLESIKNQVNIQCTFFIQKITVFFFFKLDTDFATIGATCIITAYTFDTSELILTLKIQFYQSCQNCEQLIKNVRNRLEQLKVTGQCYQDCSLSPRDCSFLATPDRSETAFADVISATGNNQGSAGDLCLIETQTTTGSFTIAT